MSRIKDSNLDSTDFEEYIDQHGLIVTGEGDGGDTCANQFTYYYCIMHNSAPIEPRLASLPRSFQLLTGPSGIPIRHPANRYGDWTASTQATSRDQLTPVLCTLATTYPHNKAYTKRLLTAHWNTTKLLKAWNIVRNGQRNAEGPYKAADITGPEIWALYIRALRLWPLYPLLIILDLQVLVAVMVDSTWFKLYSHGLIKQPPDKDQRNLALKVHSGAHIMPTPVSLLSRLLYGTKLPIWGFIKFWKEDENEPPMDELMGPLFTKSKGKV